MTSLVKQIDKKIQENPRLKSFVVVCGGRPDATRKALVELAGKNQIQNVPLTMFGEPGGPPDYELSRDADVTVLMWNRHTVRSNHAFKGKLTEKDIEAVLADIPKLLGH